jgi:hypothetical protein
MGTHAHRYIAAYQCHGPSNEIAERVAKMHVHVIRVAVHAQRPIKDVLPQHNLIIIGTRKCTGNRKRSF